VKKPVFFVSNVDKAGIERGVDFAYFPPIDISNLKSFFVGFFPVFNEFLALGHSKDKALARVADK
jgi:hypothetical protein